MTTPNIEVTSQKKIFGDGNPDGVALNSLTSPDLRSNPMQAMVQGGGTGMLFSYNSNCGSPTGPGANTIGAVSITAPRIQTGDFAIGVSNPSNQANFAFGCGLLANASNGAISINIGCVGANVAPTTNQTYSITLARNFTNVISANSGTLGICLAGNNTEYIFSLMGTGATATAIVNTAGQISVVNVVSQGAGYYVPATVVFTPAAGYGGSGATAVPIVSSGAIVGVQMLTWGSGYTSGQVTVSFVGGNTVSLGMIAMSQKPTFQANLGMGSCRVINNNQIGVTMFTTGAANVTPTPNETWQFLALNELPAISPIWQIMANSTNNVPAAANSANATLIPTPGIVALDTMIYAAPAANITNGTVTPGICTAGNISFVSYAGVAGATFPQQVFTLGVVKSSNPAPMTLLQVTLTPAAVAPGVGEQIFTLPSGFTLTANSTVIVNKPTFTPGITVLQNARANSTTTVGINFINHTSANLTPPSESYLIANFPAYVPTLSVNITEASCMSHVSSTVGQMIDLQNEVQQSLVQAGVIKGA